MSLSLDLGFRKASVRTDMRFAPTIWEVLVAGWKTGGGILTAVIAAIATFLGVYFRPTATFSGNSPLRPEVAERLSAAAQALLLLLGMGALLGILAKLSHELRRSKNPLYWQLMCWFLVAIGILLRPFVLDRKDLDIRLSAVAIAGVVAVIVLPLLMRWLNRVKPEPGLIHAALPLALGVFLDVTQLAAQSYVPKLATYLGL